MNQLCEAIGNLPLAIKLLAPVPWASLLKRLLEHVRRGLDEIAEAEEDPNLPRRHAARGPAMPCGLRD